MNQKITGIYAIHNKDNDAVYIGSSININKRLIRHKSELKNNKHPNIYLQRAYNKYGEDKFEFKILFGFNKVVTREELAQCELYFCKLVDAFNDKNYNLSTNTLTIDKHLCSIGGKIGGRIARESGQINMIKTKDSIIQGGKIAGNINRLSGQIGKLGKKQGKINVESGLLADARKKGVEVWSKEYIIIKIDGSKERIKNLSNYCKINKLPYMKIYGRAERLSNNPIQGVIARKWRI